MRPRVSLVPLLLAAWAVVPAYASPRTTVSLAGPDDTPKLGRPGIAVQVHGDEGGDAVAVSDALRRGLDRNAFTRPLAAGEAGDYGLDVTLGRWQPNGAGQALRFEAALSSSTGRPLWHVEGTTELDGVVVDASAFEGIARNVVSALLHDGWVQPRMDPDNPPPPPPVVRLAGSAP